MSANYKRVVLVTGSNTGIGLEIVRSLAQQGHTVYLSARNTQTGLEAQSQLKADHGLSVKFVQLDITSPKSVAAAKEIIEAAEGRLDSLINNAAISCMSESKGALNDSLDTIQAGFDTNFWGLIRVAQAFVPLLRRAPAGQACFVQVSTEMASNTFMASPNGLLHQVVAYNASKTAANSYLIALAKELEGEVKVNAVTPGFTTTKLNNFHPGGKTPEQGAEAIVPWALLGPEDKDKTCLFWGPNGEFPW